MSSQKIVYNGSEDTNNYQESDYSVLARYSLTITLGDKEDHFDYIGQSLVDNIDRDWRTSYYHVSGTIDRSDPSKWIFKGTEAQDDACNYAFRRGEHNSKLEEIEPFTGTFSEEDNLIHLSLLPSKPLKKSAKAESIAVKGLIFPDHAFA
eukprot:TRINITY_DN6802_c0_g1_i1.p1 TRINITY_DN6802_c0_g1~~TRINITY_DN6802_c0_g1_i1.p1  ORF type:complete len:165 (-),score=45.74 TRINITY_DN6802_c0_g1_i1:85-534(-)